LILDWDRARTVGAVIFGWWCLRLGPFAGHPRLLPPRCGPQDEELLRPVPANDWGRHCELQYKTKTKFDLLGGESISLFSPCKQEGKI
jgi:hypothetical protein